MQFLIYKKLSSQKRIFRACGLGTLPWFLLDTGCSNEYNYASGGTLKNTTLLDIIKYVVWGIVGAATIVWFFSKEVAREIMGTMRYWALPFGLLLMVYTVWEAISFFRKRRDPDHEYSKWPKWASVLAIVGTCGLFLLGLFLVFIVCASFLGLNLLPDIRYPHH